MQWLRVARCQAGPASPAKKHVDLPALGQVCRVQKCCTQAGDVGRAGGQPVAGRHLPRRPSCRSATLAARAAIDGRRTACLTTFT
jgi:hypothetical protein